MMDKEQQEKVERDSAAIASMLGKDFVGNFVIIAESFSVEGPAGLVVLSTPSMSVHAEIGMLQSALNRANLADQNGWMTGCDCDGHDE